MIEINLVPDVKLEYIRTRMMRDYVVSVSIIVGISVVSLAIILGVVLGTQLITERVQDGTIKTENDKLMKVADLDKTVTIQQQLETIDKQQSSKRIKSRLFDSIMMINPPAPNDIRISVLKLDPEEQKVTIEGSAANGYIALETFKKTITNTFVQVGADSDSATMSQLAEDIIPGSTGFGENAEGQRVLRFSFSFIYPEELFVWSSDPVTIVTPTGRLDVTDSRLGVPESLFESVSGEGE